MIYLTALSSGTSIRCCRILKKTGSTAVFSLEETNNSKQPSNPSYSPRLKDNSYMESSENDSHGLESGDEFVEVLVLVLNIGIVHAAHPVMLLTYVLYSLKTLRFTKRPSDPTFKYFPSPSRTISLRSRILICHACSSANVSSGRLINTFRTSRRRY